MSRCTMWSNGRFHMLQDRGRVPDVTGGSAVNVAVSPAYTVNLSMIEAILKCSRLGKETRAQSEKHVTIAC